MKIIQTLLLGWLIYLVWAYMEQTARFHNNLVKSHNELVDIQKDVELRSVYDYQLEIDGDSFIIYNTNTEVGDTCHADSLQSYIEKDNE